LAATGFAADLGVGLCGFTVTFDVTVVGFGLDGGRAAFLATATLRAAFFGIALPGFLATLFDFFEGICSLRLLTKERAIIPTHDGLYRACGQHPLTLFI
jgi:hypothetical protein